MDRTWRDNQTNVLNDENMTRKEKFLAGGYTFKNIGERWSNSIKIKQKKCDYLAI